jgi:hypothetical protein
MATQKTKKNESNYCCNFCDYYTCKKYDYNRHILTDKHKINILSTDSNTKNEKNMFSCKLCCKIFRDRSGLWRHKKKCLEKESVEKESVEKETVKKESVEKESVEKESVEKETLEPSEKELIIMLIKQNSFLIEQNANLVKNSVNHTTTNSYNNHSNNNTFNLQFFLNETCKDAMNLTDFVDSIQLQLSDLEKVGENGYTQGISEIIINNLNGLDVSKRPVHCADRKREILYIKDENCWEKEKEDKTKIRKIIKQIAFKNSLLLRQFREKHPDCIEYHSRYSDKYNKLCYEAYGGNGNNETEKENKIIKNIAKNVTIDKNTFETL